MKKIVILLIIVLLNICLTTVNVSADNSDTTDYVAKSDCKVYDIDFDNEKTLLVRLTIAFVPLSIVLRKLHKKKH